MIPTAQRAHLLDTVDVVDTGSGPVVALAHGAGGGVRENFTPLFALPHRFVGPYYPGAGATPAATGPLSLEALADTVVAAALEAGATRFPVVGLSLGAAVAATAAARHPEHVSALVLTVGVAHSDPQVVAVTRIWRHLADTGGLDALAELLLHSAASPSTLAALADHDGAAAAIRDTYPAGGSVHAELASRVDVRPLLPSIGVPALVVVAGQDRIVLPGTAAAFGAIPGAEVVEYPDAGHVFTPAEAERWSADVAAFLAGAGG